MADGFLDLPLEDTPAGRFLQWGCAAIIYLAILAFALAGVADRQLDVFEREPRIVTVALPPSQDRARARDEMREVLELLRGQPGVAYASLIDEQEIGSLVQPWLDPQGGGADAAGISSDIEILLPRLIDIAYNPGAAVDLEKLGSELDAIAPGATIGDAGLLQRSQERLAAVLRTAGAVVGLVLLATAACLAVWVTRVSFKQHSQAIDLLRSIGAKDRYIAQQFEQHALGSSLRGTLIGFVAGLSTIVVVLYGGPLLGAEPPGHRGLGAVHWVLLAIVPLATALLIAVAARVTALLGLARLR